MRTLSLLVLIAASGIAADAIAGTRGHRHGGHVYVHRHGYVQGYVPRPGYVHLRGYGHGYVYGHGLRYGLGHGYGHGLGIAPGTCSVFGLGTCLPDAPIGQDLQVTVESRRTAEYAMPDHDLDTLADLFAALRACWTPPADARDGMAMSVRFAFKRSGQVIAPPRITYANREFPVDARDAFRDTIMAGLDTCAPLRFTPGLAGAVAGRPIAIRYIDNRDAGAAPTP